MISPTSLAAYEEIKRNGLLTRARWEVYNVLFQSPVLLTGNDVDRIMGSPSAHKRLSELEDRGVVRQAGERVDPQTGMRNVLWEVAHGALPTSIPASFPTQPRKPRALRPPKQAKGCPRCGGSGQVITFYARGPGDPPGNTVTPCPQGCPDTTTPPSFQVTLVGSADAVTKTP